MSNQKVSYDRDSHGKVTQKNTTYSTQGGGSKTMHQKAHSNFLTPPSATKITGITTHKANGTSTYKKK